MKSLVLIGLVLAPAIWAQNVGNQKQEQPLPITIQNCNAPGSCQQESSYVVMDSNWRWTHTVRNTHSKLKKFSCIKFIGWHWQNFEKMTCIGPLIVQHSK